MQSGMYTGTIKGRRHFMTRNDGDKNGVETHFMRQKKVNKGQTSETQLNEM